MASTIDAHLTAHHLRTHHRTHTSTVADALVIVTARAFMGFMCVRKIEPSISLVATITAVNTMMPVVAQRGVAQGIDPHQKLVHVRATRHQERAGDDE